MHSHVVTTGLERLLKEPAFLPESMRFGLLCNAASVDSQLRHSATLLFSRPRINLTALFGPQHGLFTTRQDNMIESPHGVDPFTGLPIYSLYSETRKPTGAMLSGIDGVLVDLQDVGCRVYTYIWTLSLMLEACAEAGLPVWILDRPNPLGDCAEGNLLDAGYESFVGRCAIPMRHGLTIGEFAALFTAVSGSDVDLHIISMQGYRPDRDFRATRLPWVMPSPNMPTLETARVYPGMVLLEGTNISEGRGTTRPFEIFGAPFVDPEKFSGALNDCGLEGVFFRPLYFEPAFHKFEGKVCGGAQIHVTDNERFRPYRCGLSVLSVLKELYPHDFRWLDPPYEYEEELMPIDILTGCGAVREAVDGGASISALEDSWQEELSQYEKRRKEFRLYEKEA